MPLLLISLLVIGFLVILKLRKDPKAKKRLVTISLTILIAFLLLRFGQLFLALGAVLFPIIIYLFRIVISNPFILQIAMHRVFSKFSRRKHNGNSGSFNNQMTKQEASEILGVNSNASKEEVIKQYKELMKRNHPDKGGSKKIAILLNEAKSVMLS